MLPPSLDPVLEGGKGHQHPVSAPQGPAGGAGGPAVFHHQAPRSLGHTMGVRTARGGHIGPSDVAIRLALGAVVVGRGDQEGDRTPRVSSAAVGDSALVGLVARGEMATSGARRVLVVPTIGSQVRWGEVLDIDKALRRVWHVFTRATHGGVPL